MWYVVLYYVVRNIKVRSVDIFPGQFTKTLRLTLKYVLITNYQCWAGLGHAGPRFLQVFKGNWMDYHSAGKLLQKHFLYKLERQIIMMMTIEFYRKFKYIPIQLSLINPA